jgi:antitoxin component YwqK of YwqJK toxin-antitoxin module
MKNLQYVLLSYCLLFSGCTKKVNQLSDTAAKQILKDAVHIDDAVELSMTAVEVSSVSIEDGRIYWGNSDRTYTGWIKNRYKSGTIQNLYQLKDGIPNGIWTTWRENGKKEYEATYKNDKLDGLTMAWHENGQKKSEENFKNDKLDGLTMTWHENGQKEAETNFKGDKKDGLFVMWHENGQKMVEGKMKNGKWEELVNEWHKNGQKKSEQNYKDGKPVDGSLKYWNSKGEPVDSRKEAESE